jgi:predicted O-methyltransferase YrrM
MNTVRELCKYLGQVVTDSPVCIETGSMYTCPPGNEVHNTTNNIVEFICLPNNGSLLSFDIDQSHIEFAQNYIAHLDCPDVTFVLGDSAEMMAKEIPPLSPGEEPFEIDVLCLDSKEFDEDHMVNEFNAVKDFLKSDKHFVLVDDIHNPNSVKYKKMVPILKQLGYEWVEIPTPTGMFVATKGYALP